MWARWLAHWRRWRHRDSAIERLIRANTAKARPEMAAVDWAKVDRAGQVRWQEALRAQHRRLPTAGSISVVRFRK